MDRIDITMTATLRPEIIEKMFIDIRRRIVKTELDRYRLIINIDNIGESVNPNYIVRIAKNYFPVLLYNISTYPSFTKAVKWVWRMATSKFVFHIEDDWIITRDVDVDDMIRILKKYNKLSSLRLNKRAMPNLDIVEGTFDGRWEYMKDDNFYICTDKSLVLSLNPNLIKREFIDDILPHMNDKANPEKQFSKNENVVKAVQGWLYGLYSKPGDEALVLDNGKVWRKKNKFQKPVGQPFLTWRKNNEL